MAGATLLTLLDDIASILENVSSMSQVAIKKTAGVLGDDLALNAKQKKRNNKNKKPYKTKHKEQTNQK